MADTGNGSGGRSGPDSGRTSRYAGHQAGRRTAGRTQIIILGAGVMQGPAISIAREMGLESVVVDGDPRAVNAPLADRFERIDLKDKEGVERLARELQAEGRLGGIMTAGTDFSATVAWVAERLGLPGIPYETALDASDKGRMRRRFEAAGVPSPRFVVITAPPVGGTPGGDLPGAGLPFDYPAVIKPVDNMGARGCRRVDSREDLDTALPDAFAFSRSGRVIVEEYMEGPEFSVDALVYHGELFVSGLADRHIFFPPYFIEMGHTIPSSLDAKAAESLLDTFAAGVFALGILAENNTGAAKGDVKLTPRGPMIGEIAARLSGGYMSGWTWPYASGIEPTRGAILAALGRRPDGLSPRRSWVCAERAFISLPGKVRAIRGLRAAKAAPLVKDVFLRAEPGSRVSFPENNVSKCGNVLAAAPDRAAAIEAAESAARGVLVALECPDAETAGFLAAGGTVPVASAAVRAAPGMAGGAASGVSAGAAAAGTVPAASGAVRAAPGMAGGAASGVSAGAAAETVPVASGGGLAAAIWPPSAFAVGPAIAEALAALPDPEPPGPGAAGGELGLIPFPALAGSGLRDWMGRSVAESLEAVRILTGLALPECGAPGASDAVPDAGDAGASSAGRAALGHALGESGRSGMDAAPVLGRRFWAALIRGGYQGAVYMVETFLNECGFDA